MSWKLYISDSAGQEINDIWYRGFENFGMRVADDYELLIQQALRDLMEDPYRAGTKPVPGHKEGIYSYLVSHSKTRSRGNIKHPRHVVFYYVVEEHTVAIASISRQAREHHIKALHRDAIIKEMPGSDENE